MSIVAIWYYGKWPPRRSSGGLIGIRTTVSWKGSVSAHTFLSGTTRKKVTDRANLKTLLVTGANGRLGTIVAEKFDGLGYEVLGIDSRVEGAKVDPCYQADLTDGKSVEAVFSRIWAEHGRIDVLIHTVGMWDGHPTAGLELERWREVIDVNLTTTFLCFRAMLRQHST